MSSLRVLVCDDEPLAARRLASMLSRVPDVELVATAGGGREALDMVADTRPDLLLVDIEMPDVDGFDVVESVAKLVPGEPPLVAFVTAYRKFAPQAFESGAIDFLPKPVRLGRLEATLARARDAVGGREAARRLIELQAMLDDLRANRGPVCGPHVWVPRRGEIMRVDLDHVQRVAAEGAYVRLHLEGGSYLHREPIGAIEAKLDPLRFVRVHRSHLVRTDQVSSIRRTIHGGGELVLRDGACVPLGRKYARSARQRLLGSASARDLESTGTGGSKGWRISS